MQHDLRQRGLPAFHVQCCTQDMVPEINLLTLLDLDLRHSSQQPLEAALLWCTELWPDQLEQRLEFGRHQGHFRRNTECIKMGLSRGAARQALPRHELRRISR